MSGSLGVRRGKPVLPKVLCSLSILCACPPGHRPLEDRGPSFLSSIHPFTPVLNEPLSVPGPVLGWLCETGSCFRRLPVWWEVRARPRQGGIVLGLQGQDGIPGALCPAEGRAGVACGIDMLGQVPPPTSSVSSSAKQPPQKVFVASQGGECTWKEEHSCSANRVLCKQRPWWGGPAGKCCSYVRLSVPQPNPPSTCWNSVWQTSHKMGCRFCVVLLENL